MNKSNPREPRITLAPWVSDIPGVNHDELLAIAKRAIRLRRDPPALSRATYERSLVTFIDLLGFRKFVADHSAREVAQALSLFYYSGKEVVVKGPQLRVYAFSDSIVRVRAVKRREGPPDYYHDLSPVTTELRNLARIQFELSCWYGLFLRGGISYGNVYARPGMVFGQGLIDVYELEATSSIYPRILIHPKLFSALRTESALWQRRGETWTSPLTKVDERFPIDLEATASSLGNCLMQDEHGHVFLDYLTPEIKDATLDYLLQHKNLLELSYEASRDSRVQDKYAWLSHYHNYAIKTDTDFNEIGIADANIHEFSILRPEIMNRMSPGFRRIRHFHTEI